VGGPTASSSYWSASTGAGDPGLAWPAGFNNGFVYINAPSFKTDDDYVRAVRAGSCN
jgi:hypothetical protein